MGGGIAEAFGKRKRPQRRAAGEKKPGQFAVAIAGVLATFYYGTMDFGAGLVFGLKVVLISAAGGYASPLICGLGAAAVGFAETFWVGYGPAAWRDAAVLAMLVGWLIVMRSNRGVI
ncbi:hypothetical protein D3C72_1621160 [compost metagenome]